jgi:hypothetical protein
MEGPEPGFEPGTEDPQSHMLPGYTTRAMFVEEAMFHEIFKSYAYVRQTTRTPTLLLSTKNAGVAKLGQRRKIQSLVLSGPRVQISSPALFFI